MSELTFYTTAEVADLLRLNPQVVQRKLQAGEIPAYRIGREWRVERAQLIAWLERHSNQRARTPEAKVLDVFIENGRLKALPVPHKKRLIVLNHIADRFARDRTYTEKEVNDVLRTLHDDVASIRRELIGEKLMVRKNGIYKRTGSTNLIMRRA
ncbi:MAG: DUF2087 domain-containing protein [Actinomycetota bacterium]